MLQKVKTKIRKITSSFFLFLFSKKIAFGMNPTFYGGPDIDSVYIKKPEQPSLMKRFVSQVNKFSIFIYAVCFLIIGLVCMSKKISNKLKIIISSIFIIIIILFFIIMQLNK